VLHGWGVACGLGVELHWNSACRRDQVIVRCGMAIDCCGREILVRKDVVSPLIPWKTVPTDAATGTPVEGYVLVLCLCYRECTTERVPVLYSQAACSTASFEDGRIREGYELCWRWVLADDLRDYGWNDPRNCVPPDYDQPASPPPVAQKQAAQTPPSKPDRDDRADDCPDDDRPPRCCLTPACPPHHCVVLAVIRVTNPDDFGEKDQLELRGRRSIAQASEHLTHICWVNWEHGGRVQGSTMKNLMVRFDRPLLVEPQPKNYPGPRGINERTFVVQYGEQADRRQIEDLDFVEYLKPPYLLPDRRTAVYEFEKPFRSYRDHVIHVTLRCDFIVDCLKRPVDGNHLGGLLPTGDGVAGGTFESWFVIVDDADYASAEFNEKTQESQS
jgi:hypothetical protein